MKYRISTSNERVWCTTWRAKLSFNHKIGRTHSGRFWCCYINYFPPPTKSYFSTWNQMEPERDLIKKTKNILAWSRDEKSRRADLEYCRRPLTQVLRSALLTNGVSGQTQHALRIGRSETQGSLEYAAVRSPKECRARRRCFCMTFAHLDTRCEDYYTMWLHSQPRRVQRLARRASFHSTTSIGSEWLHNLAPAMAATFGESHSAERRHSPSTCCCWLAEHRQCVRQRGS